MNKQEGVNFDGVDIANALLSALVENSKCTVEVFEKLGIMDVELKNLHVILDRLCTSQRLGFETLGARVTRIEGHLGLSKESL